MDDDACGRFRAERRQNGHCDDDVSLKLKGDDSGRIVVRTGRREKRHARDFKTFGVGAVMMAVAVLRTTRNGEARRKFKGEKTDVAMVVVVAMTRMIMKGL